MNRTAATFTAIAALVLGVTACGGGGDAPGGPTAVLGSGEVAAPEASAVTATVVADGLSSPWALAFLPDGRMLVTQKGGSFRLVSPDGTTSAPIGGAPAVAAAGQGGLLDVVLSPDFARDATVFFSYAEPAPEGARTAVARAVLDGTTLREVRTIFRQQPAVAGGEHFGSRLAFAPDGTLFVTLGDRQRPQAAQDLGTHLGKVVRIRPDGTVPPDNPFVGREGALPEIWSYGHRNPQGAAIEPSSRRLWISEHGPGGGDEINAPAAGANHGWPEVTTGRDYDSGEPLGVPARADVVPPLRDLGRVSVAPAGMAFHASERVPGWRGDLFAGALAGRALLRLVVRDGRVVGEQRLLASLDERIRDVETGPDGALHLLTDGGRLLRVAVR